MALFDMFKKKGPEPEPTAQPEPVAQPEPEPEVQPEPVPAEPALPEPAAQPEPESDPAQPDPEAAEPDPDQPTMTTEQVQALQAALNRTYPGLSMLARDVNLTYEQASKYEVGMIIREPAHVDASRRVMGMVTTHRYAILSNHMEEPTGKELEIGPNWGLRVAEPGSYFKVLGKHTYQGKTVIFLLHLPKDDWKLFINTVIDSDAELIRKCIARFEAKCLKAPIPDLAMPNWQERCGFPIGMDNFGNLFPLEDAPETPAPAETPEAEESEETEDL